MLQRSFRAFGLIIVAALTLIFLSAGFQQRVSLDDLLWTPTTPSPDNGATGVSLYRQQLGLVRELDRTAHSRTLGVAQRIYVIGLARRKDRRKHMESLVRAMDIDVEWYDALDMHARTVTDIFERIRWARAQSRIGHEHDIPNPQGLHFTWLPGVGSDGPVPPREGADLWFLPPGDPQGLKPLPPPPSPDNRPPVLRTSGESDLMENEIITRAQVSCWYSHYQVLLKIARGPDEVAIIFEDDIDMEFDLEKRLRQMWTCLPKDWDIVMLGHCMSNENENPPANWYVALHYPAPGLNIDVLADHAFQHFNHHKILNIFSVEPAVVVQTKNTVSDIVDGTGGRQDEWLADSAMERVAYFEKLQLEKSSA